MDANWRPSDADIKKVMEAHGVLPEGTLLDEAFGLASLYADVICKRLHELPASVDRGKAVMAIIEEGLMQEGIIPDWHEKKFEMAIFEEILAKEGIIHKRPLEKSRNAS